MACDYKALEALEDKLAKQVNALRCEVQEQVRQLQNELRCLRETLERHTQK